MARRGWDARDVEAERRGVANDLFGVAGGAGERGVVHERVVPEDAPDELARLQVVVRRRFHVRRDLEGRGREQDATRVKERKARALLEKEPLPTQLTRTQNFRARSLKDAVLRVLVV